MKRSELPDNVFGIPEERKYPMPDKRHTLSAIKLFGHVEPKYEEELAKNIIKNMKKYNIPESTVGKDNKLRKYIDKYYKEASLVEGYVFNDKDIYYNKDKFDSGEINLCFITGHSDSGKSTMGRNMEKDKVEHYELDDLLFVKDHFTMQNLKEYGDLMYSYFAGQGKKFYAGYKEIIDTHMSEYEDILFKDFVHFAMRYAKVHKDRKIVIEGVWLYERGENKKAYFTPEEFKDYAFYIKGTSMLISSHRAALRDAKEEAKNKKETIEFYLNKFFRRKWKLYFIDEQVISKFREYFTNLTKKDSTNEGYITSDPNKNIPIEVLEEAGRKCIEYSKWCAMDDFKYTYITPAQPNKIWVNEEDNTFTFATYNGKQEYLPEIVDCFNKNNLFKYGKFRVYAKDVYDEDTTLSNHMNTKWWLRGEVIEYNNSIQEETRLEENKIPCLYHLSTENHDGDVFEPRYYDNDNVKAGTERRVKRICFSDNINGCIYSIFPNGAYDIDLYVHIPASEVSKVYETTSDDIYDSEITHELWVKEPVTMKCIGKIHISGVDKDKVKILEADKDKIGYGKRKYYEPKWSWVEKNNSPVQEKYVFNEDDIYYNKDKFDAGLTNLCFITGHGGSGKSTMGAYMAQDKNIEHVEMDDVIWCWRFINRPFEHGSMLESFFTVGPGKKYLGTSKQEMRIKFPNYDEDIIREFMDFAYKFTRTHKNKKYAIEGVQLFLYINPEELIDYAVYIKGTSACVSIFRAVKRDYQKYKNATTSEKIKKSIDRILIKLENVKETEMAIQKYRDYFSSKQVNEAEIGSGSIDGPEKSSIVYFTKYITPYSLIKIFKALGKEMKGNVAVKISTGELGGHNFLHPLLIKDLVEYVNGTIVECNTAYKGHRNTTEDHWTTIRTHGFCDIARVDLMDEEGDFEIPVYNGYHLSSNLVGTHLKNYDSMIMLSHFKGHTMAGYGGALKNMSIGVSSSRGKLLIHTAGAGGDMMAADRDKFLESMVDADQSVMDYMGRENIIYINVANNLSVDCDCDAHPEEPKISDIGIFASLDPVAVDQACIDAVYSHNNPEKKDLIERIESRNGTHTIDCAEAHGLGSTKYTLVSIDDSLVESTDLKEFSVGAGPVVGIGSNPEPIYIVNYIQNNVFSGATQERFGICKTGMADLHTFGGKYNRLHYTDLDAFEKEASDIKMYRYTGSLSDTYPSIYSIIEDSDTDLDFYRLLTGEDISNRSDIKNNPNFVKESYVRDELSAISECVIAGAKELNNKYEIPLLGLNEDGRSYNYYRDLDGVYIKNEVTNMRSASYNSVEDILEDVSNLVKKGVY